MAYEQEFTLIDFCKVVLAMVGMPLLSLAFGLAVGSLALAVGLFLVANPWVGLSALFTFFKAKHKGASTSDAMAESGLGMANADNLQKLWEKLLSIIS